MKYIRFLLVTFVLSILMCSPIFAKETSTLFRDIYDYQNTGHYLLNKSDAIKEWVVYVEDTQDVYILFSNLGVCYYYMPGDVGAEELTFYDGYYHQINKAATTIPYNSSAAKTAPYDMYLHYEHLGNPADAVYYDSVYENIGEFLEDLSKYDSLKDFIDRKESENNNDFLPCLTYKAYKKWYAKLTNDFWRYNLHISWNYNEKSPYKENPSLYKVQIIGFINGINSEFQQFSNEATWYWITKEANLSANDYSFSLEDTVNNIREKFNIPPTVPTLTLAVYYRTIEPSTGKYSKWKGLNVVDPCGSPNIQPFVYPDDYDGSDNNIDTSDDTSYDNGGYSQDSGGDDSRNDPTSDNYVDPSDVDGIESFISNLKSIIMALGDVPALFNQVYLWLPEDLIILISSAIGLGVLVGVVKWAL